MSPRRSPRSEQALPDKKYKWSGQESLFDTMNFIARACWGLVARRWWLLLGVQLLRLMAIGWKISRASIAPQLVWSSNMLWFFGMAEKSPSFKFRAHATSTKRNNLPTYYIQYHWKSAKIFAGNHFYKRSDGCGSGCFDGCQCFLFWTFSES